ncbi:hypothetical protein J4E93_008090 [Alternaria ventricosa]|uniref:uncharacterized protein n=1 Tax=Alternaria ventricosa TaxID=1187951 RepID=UPI0020C582B6|nr:uncharacterized protein J4E93_008090 [Alternaria ventricosa]KAI4641211.1 hypothetical protein J4E93_008090 [Alternaria ventricosa]
MQLLLLLLAGLFATLTSACGFPFNNNRLTNSSLVDDFIADLEVSGQLGDNGGQGWMSVINDRIPDRTVWPDLGPENDPYVWIDYCYATEKDYNELHDVVEDAAKEWMTKLGKGKDNGHRFAGFRHYYYEGVYPRCDKDDEWNELQLLDSSQRHRDDHVNFDCSKLYGYETAKKKVETEPAWEGKTIEDVCGSNWLGYMHGLHFAAPTAYCTDMGLAKDDRTPLAQYSDTTYNYDSIMHYYSQAFAANQRGAVNELPLVRWKNGRPSDGSGPNDENAQIIPTWSVISDGDKSGVQHYYPYAGPTENEQDQGVQDVGVWG